MSFSKAFPRYVGKSTYPVWEEIILTEEEEREAEELARKENLELMEKCMDDAKKTILKKNLKDYQSDIIRLASALFEKLSAHMVYYKESMCKDKFDKKFK